LIILITSYEGPHYVVFTVVMYTYKCVYRFINPNWQVSYIFLLTIIRGNSFPIHHR
jgi:hypothetical protein